MIKEKKDHIYIYVCVCVCGAANLHPSKNTKMLHPLDYLHSFL